MSSSLFDSDPISLKYQSLWRGIAYVMLAVIFIASLLPAEHLPKGGNDKVQHLVSYAVLAWWCTLAFQPASLKQLFLLIIKLILFGGLIEILQGLSGYRYAEWLDLLANGLGVLIGCFIAFKLTRYFIFKLDNLLNHIT